MLPQQSCGPLEELKEGSPRAPQPPVTIFLGSSHPPYLDFLVHSPPLDFCDLPATPSTLSKPPPCHSVCFLPERACHSSRQEGMHAIRLTPQMDVQREFHRRMSTNKQDSGFVSAGMKGLDASETDIHQKFCLPAWGMWSPFHARVSCCGCLRTGTT